MIFFFNKWIKNFGNFRIFFEHYINIIITDEILNLFYSTEIYNFNVKDNKWKFNFNPKNIKTGKLQKSLINASDGKVAVKQGTKINPAIAKKLFNDGLKNLLIEDDELIGKFVADDIINEKTGEIYEGEFVNDKRSGYGVLLKKNDYKYEGYWKDNDAHGKGKITILKRNENEDKGTIIKGIFLKGLQQGKFEKIFPNGDILDCMYVDSICTKAKYRGDKKWTIFKKSKK